MEQDFNKEHWEQKKCPQYDCRKKQCECGLEKVFLSAALGDDSKDSPVAPKNGEYCNAIVVYEANGHVYIYSQEGIPTLVESEGSNVEEIIEQLEGRLDQEVLDRQAADNVLQGEIDDIKNSPDVVDIVATYAALQAYDTSKLGDNDIVRVLQDEQHDGQSTYYRWNKQSSTWTYIGAVGDYYTKGQVDTLLGDKQDKLTAGSNISIAQVDNDLVISATDTTYTAGTNVSISSGNVISATDTTYSDFTGATIQQAGASGLVPAPTTSDPDKYLKGDGSWGTPTGTTYTAGTNVQISSGNVISATDTTYSAFTGTDGNTPGTSGLVPAPATTDAGKFLKADGTWATAGGDETITILTSADYNYPINNPNSVSLGLLNNGFYRPADDTVYIYENNRRNNRSICLYYVSGTNSNNTKFAYVFYPNADVSSGDYKINTLGYDPTTGSAVSWANKGILSEDYVVNNLNSNASERVLSAAQGKALKDLIAETPYYIDINDLPSVGSVATGKSLYLNNTMTAGDKISGQAFFSKLTNTSPNDRAWKLVILDTSQTPNLQTHLYLAEIHKANPNIVSPSPSNISEAVFSYYDGTEERSLRIWASGTGSNDFNYALDAIGGGGGGSPVTLLTSADYNWDSSGQGGDPDAIAGWLLNDGWYITDGNTNVYLNSDNGDTTGVNTLIQVSNGGMSISAIDSGIIVFNEVNTADGTISGGYVYPDGTMGPYEFYMSDWGDYIKQIPRTDSGAPDISTEGALGQLYTDADTMYTYQCTAIDDTDPDNIEYTWTQRW